jgi:Mlc titration factor MtfA (ptsG expression regulator)
MFGLWRAWRRRGWLREPVPESWRALAEAHLPFLPLVAPEDEAAFWDHLRIFVRGRNWEGAGGLEVTEEMKVVVGGIAARLARRLPYGAYDHLSSVVLYPSHYKHKDEEHIVFGEANRWGTVVLSWDAVRHGIGNPRDGHDTALHEFAHVLDVADGEFDGTPPLDDHAQLRAWAGVFSEHFLRLRSDGRRRRALLRQYGATNEAEFFAVATEAFFEKPSQMRKKAPDLYEELKRFYGLDPDGG